MATPAMKTVDRALALLRYFTVQKPELGLSELARLAGHDKATTLRCMTALERNGFVEQDATSRKYRLGLAPINLARIREQSFPVQAVIKPHLDRLASLTGETAHASLLSGTLLLTALISEPDRALRVYVDPTISLPMHATASGIIVAAFLPKDIVQGILAAAEFEVFTDKTPTGRAQIEARIAEARQTGLAQAMQTFETDVIGTAVAIFGPAGTPIGAIAVAAVSMRYNEALARTIAAELRNAARDITRALGGIPPQ